jgi:hypothetical protein
MGKVWCFDDPPAHYDDPAITWAAASDLLPKTMADKPITFSITEVLGFCDATIALLNSRKTR